MTLSIMEEPCYPECHFSSLSLLLSFTNKPLMLSVIMLNVVILSVMVILPCYLKFVSGLTFV